MRLAAVALVSTLAVLLGGCSWRKDAPPASVPRGECKIYKRAEYAYAGKAREDQRWIDKMIETGVAGCKFKRPAARPLEWDAAR